jgi:hypothetical protein
LTTPLQENSTYSMQVAGGVITDLYGNAYAGTTQSFTTAAAGAPAPSLLISEVNSNAVGGDFFEIYNYGSTPINLTGWKWGDNHVDVNDANNSAAFARDTILAPGDRLVVISAAPGSEAAFRTTWNLAAKVTVVATLNVNNDAANPIGLGKGDAVILYDANGNVAASLNYGTPVNATQGDGTTKAVATALGANASVVNGATGHAGAVFNGSATASAVWDGVSTAKPNYVVAVVGVNGGKSQAASASSIGSPGQ